MIRDTSWEAYKEIEPHINERQSAVLELLKNHPPLTNSEIGYYLGWPINTVTPRVNELVKKGLLTEWGKRACRITNRLVHEWGLTENKRLVAARWQNNEPVSV